MTTKRLAILFVLLAGGFGSVFFLPAAPKEQPVGIVLELPKFIGAWYGTDLAISDKERTVLGAETDFARKSYKNGRGDEVQVSIVLSGHDMNTSIHRPERCLPAQGWTIASKKGTEIAIPDRGKLPMTRMLNTQPRRSADGKITATIFNLNYFVFVGHTDVTGSHLGRTIIDAPGGATRMVNEAMPSIPIVEADQVGPDDDFQRLNPGNSAPMVVWLASEEALHVSGQVFRAVGDEITHYQPWKLGNSVKAGREPEKWDPAKIGDAVASGIYGYQPGGLQMGGA